MNVCPVSIRRRITFPSSSSAFRGHIQQFVYSAKEGFRTRKRERKSEREKDREREGGGGEREKDRIIIIYIFLERDIICSGVRIIKGDEG